MTLSLCCSIINFSWLSSKHARHPCPIGRSWLHDDWAECVALFHVAMNPPFVILVFSYAPISRSYEKRKYLRQVTFSINYFSIKVGLFFYIYPSTLIMFLFSSCILCFVIHVLIIPLLFLIAVDWTKMPWVRGGRGGRGVTRNLNDFYPRGALDGSETAESSKVGGRRGHKRSPTS
jgi:hypothetical protein